MFIPPMCPGSGLQYARRLCHVDNSAASKGHFDTDTPPRKRDSGPRLGNVPPHD